MIGGGAEMMSVYGEEGAMPSMFMDNGNLALRALHPQPHQGVCADAIASMEKIDRTLDILRKQRRTFALRPQAEAAAEGDRATIDFEGKIDGVPFEGGKAEAFQFILGEGQMLEAF